MTFIEKILKKMSPLKVNSYWDIPKEPVAPALPVLDFSEATSLGAQGDVTMF